MRQPHAPRLEAIVLGEGRASSVQLAWQPKGTGSCSEVPFRHEAGSRVVSADAAKAA